MKTLKNQTLYQCEYCGKRLLTKHGVKLHESTFCKSNDSPGVIAFRLKQAQCEHKNTETVWIYLDGDSMPVPDYEKCSDCGEEF